MSTKPTVIFRSETFDIAFPEMLPLLQKHYKEIAHYQDIELKIDEELYANLYKAGVLRIYTARKDGVLVGYSVYLLKHNGHYKDSYQANQDVLYVDREHRGIGMALINWCDEELRKEKVQVVYHHVKAAHNFGHMLERMDYKLVDLIYAKRLDKESV